MTTENWDDRITTLIKDWAEDSHLSLTDPLIVIAKHSAYYMEKALNALGDLTNNCALSVEPEGYLNATWFGCNQNQVFTFCMMAGTPAGAVSIMTWRIGSSHDGDAKFDLSSPSVYGYIKQELANFKSRTGE